MKKIITISILFLISLCSLGQTTNSERKEKTDLEKLIFEVKLNKESYLPFEPIFVTFELSNKTDEIVKTEHPKFLHDSEVKIINPQGKKIEIRGLSLTSVGGPNLPGENRFVINARQSYKIEDAPAIPVNIYDQPGKYKLQFIFNGLESNIVDMEVVSPEGLDKNAFNFINGQVKNIRFGSTLFGVMLLQEKNGSDLLKMFVDRYGESGYGVYAIDMLGTYYLSYEKDMDKAEAEFEKIKSSENKFIANNACKILKEIEKRKTELESKKPN